MTARQVRLREARQKVVPRRRWGPNVSERQGGFVRENLGESGDIRHAFSHDQAWCCTFGGWEDLLAGISVRQQRLYLGLARWNGKDPIAQERLIPLTNSQGNDGEHVKEFYPLCYKYFHGHTGAGLGGSHQAGCTRGIVRTLYLFATGKPESRLRA